MASFPLFVGWLSFLLLVVALFLAVGLLHL